VVETRAPEDEWHDWSLRDVSISIRLADRARRAWTSVNPFTVVVDSSAPVNELVLLVHVRCRRELQRILNARLAKGDRVGAAAAESALMASESINAMTVYYERSVLRLAGKLERIVLPDSRPMYSISLGTNSKLFVEFADPAAVASTSAADSAALVEVTPPPMTLCEEIFERDRYMVDVKFNAPSSDDLPNQPVRYACKIRIDRRVPVLELKRRICEQLGVGEHSVRLYRGFEWSVWHSSDGVEIADVERSIDQHMLAGSSLLVRFGAPMRPGRVLLKVMHFRPEELVPIALWKEIDVAKDISTAALRALLETEYAADMRARALEAKVPVVPSGATEAPVEGAEEHEEEEEEEEEEEQKRVGEVSDAEADHEGEADDGDGDGGDQDDDDADEVLPARVSLRIRETDGTWATRIITDSVSLASAFGALSPRLAVQVISEPDPVNPLLLVVQKWHTEDWSLGKRMEVMFLPGTKHADFALFVEREFGIPPASLLTTHFYSISSLDPGALDKLVWRDTASPTFSDRVLTTTPWTAFCGDVVVVRDASAPVKAITEAERKALSNRPTVDDDFSSSSSSWWKSSWSSMSSLSSKKHGGGGASLNIKSHKRRQREETERKAKADADATTDASKSDAAAPGGA
jgi:hypothetical protein